MLSTLTKKNLSDTLETVLVRDGDSIVSTVKNIELLLVAKIILVDCSKQINDCQAGTLWSIRCCSILTSVLEEKTKQINDLILNFKRTPLYC